MAINLDGTTGISASGNITGGNILTAGLISATGNITGGNIIGTLVATNISLSGNITGGNLNTGGVVSSTGNVIGGNLVTGGQVTATGNITGGNILGGANVNATTHTGTTVSVTGNVNGGNLISAALVQGVTLSASGNVIGGNITTVGLISATGNITGGNVLGGANVNATTHTGTTVSVTGNVNGGNLISAALVQGVTLSASGNVIGGNVTVSTGTVTLGNIVNANGNAVGNIGSSSLYFNTAFVKSTSSQYADLAESYQADFDYEPGTVLDFGGIKEVTISINPSSTRVAGVVSTHPAHLMNTSLGGENTVAVALVGRVPTKVVGPVSKGDLMVSAGNGHAMASSNPSIGTVIGKALEDLTSTSGIIEIVVGIR